MSARVLALILLLPSLAVGQTWSGNVRVPAFTLPPTTVNGTAITPSSVGVPASTCAAPGVYLTTATTTGMAFTATPSVILCVNGTGVLTTTSSAVESTVPFQFPNNVYLQAKDPSGAYRNLLGIDANSFGFGVFATSAALAGAKIGPGELLTLTTTQAAFTVPVVPASIAFASLPASSNGAQFYCSNCTKATPCAGGGGGALAVRIGGAWDCNP